MVEGIDVVNGTARDWAAITLGTHIVGLLGISTSPDVVHYPLSLSMDGDMTNVVGLPRHIATPQWWLHEQLPQKNVSGRAAAAAIIVNSDQPSTPFSELRGASIAASGCMSANSSPPVDRPSRPPALAAAPVVSLLGITWCSQI
jgi:hypothetical protein